MLLSVQNSPLRSGVFSLTLNDEGYTAQKAGCVTSIGWEHFDAAIDTQQGLMLLHGVGEFKMVPKDTFQENVAASDLCAQINKWIKLSKVKRED